MKIVIADDSVFPREGVAGLAEKRGHEVIAMVDAAHGLVTDIDDRFDDTGELPDLVITDVRMPLKMSDDGLRAAVELRERYPQLNVMMLLQYVTPTYARELFSSSGAGGSAGVGTGVDSSGSSSSGGTGYLLKDRVGQVSDFLGPLEIVAGDGVVIDPDVATVLIQSDKSGSASLTVREREVPELMARGKSNKQIADDLMFPGAAVAKHVSNIFMKLYLEPGKENHRARATLEFLTATSGRIQGRQ